MKIKIIMFFAISIIISSVITGCQSKNEVTGPPKVTEESNTSKNKTMETPTAQSTELQKATEKKKPIKDKDNTHQEEPSETAEIPTEESVAEMLTTEESAAEMLTTEGYVLRVEGSIMYLDEVNTGGRTYGEEGQDRATAYDLSNAVINAPGGVRSGLTVDLTYYIENNINKALEVNSDGDEKEPMVPYVLPDETNYENES